MKIIVNSNGVFFQKGTSFGYVESVDRAGPVCSICIRILWGVGKLVAMPFRDK
jgi:hypothetical protein